MSLFKSVFNYETPDQMLQTLHRVVDNCIHAASSTENNFADLYKLAEDSVKTMWGDKKNNGIKILNVLNKILDFTLKEQKQREQGLKMLTPNQILSRLPISLAQLKAGNNSEKLKNEIRQLLYSLNRPKKLTKQLYKIWLTCFKT